METKILLLIGGAIVGFVLGHIFAAMFDIRSKDNPGVPSEKFSIGGGILGAIAGGVVAIYFIGT